jgi:hypothetical protein
MGAALGVFQKKVFATCRFSVLSTCYDVSAWKRSDETFRLDFSLLLKVNLGFFYETAHFVGRMVPRLEIPSSRGQKYGYQKESFGEIQENRCDESS